MIYSDTPLISWSVTVCLYITVIYKYQHGIVIRPALVAQLDAPSDWRPGGRGFNPRRGRQHSFAEIDLEYFLRSFSPFR